MKSVPSKSVPDGIRTRGAYYTRTSSSRNALKFGPVIPPEDAWLSVPQVAKQLGCADKTVKRLIIHGPLKGQFRGTRLMVRESWLAEYEKSVGRKRAAISLLDASRPERGARAR